jgi:hypothetical protein
MGGAATVVVIFGTRERWASPPHEFVHVEFGQLHGAEQILTDFHNNGVWIQQTINKVGMQQALEDPEFQKRNDQQINNGYVPEHRADERAWEVVQP